jgi:crotonobetainyl-CoA:carnitine CoA-transferase CaiB-like acyl-CoA transferase
VSGSPFDGLAAIGQDFTTEQHMNTDSNGYKGPLDGLKVIDWTMWQFGPISTVMLADMGAEVIKVESLDGDHGRQFGQIMGINTELADGVNAYFESMNRQKLGIALDLKNPRGLKILHKLVAESDIFVENFRKGVAERLGLGYEDLLKHNEKIIYASASGYGPKGPDSAKPALELAAEARAGALWWTGPDDGMPYPAGMADQIGGIMLSYGIVGAIVARERFGFGQRVDASHLGSMIWAHGMPEGIKFLTGKEFPRTDRTIVGQPLWNYYQCKDGEWLAFSMSQNRYWSQFCNALGIPECIEDPRFSTTEVRADNREELIPLLDDVFATKNREEWEAELAKYKDLIWERVQRSLDLLDDPQVVENNYVVEFDHPVVGPTKWPQTPLTYSKTPLSTRKMAPTHGENTEEILLERLGYTWDDIVSLKDDGVIL